MAAWFWYAVLAAILYGAHQIFTRLAAERIGDGLGGFIVEASAALSILIYLAILWFCNRWNQKFSTAGFNYSLLTGICVGAGTIAFFLLFQKGGPLSAVPAILAGGAAIMAIAGILFFHEAPSWQTIARNRAGDCWIIFAAQLAFGGFEYQNVQESRGALGRSAHSHFSAGARVRIRTSSRITH